VINYSYRYSETTKMTKKPAPKPVKKAKPNSDFLASSGTVATTRRSNGSKTPPKRVKAQFSAAAERLMDASQSAATKRAYASDLRHFALHRGTIPTTAAKLVEYLALAAETLSAATLERRLIAIHKAHIEIGLRSPTIDATVKRMMQGIRRTRGIKQRQVKPMVKDDLLEALVVIDKQKPVKAARDRALLLIGFAGAFRRCELVAIKIEHIAHVSNGIEIFLPNSKTDQAREGATIFIPHANGERCPVSALTQWLEIADVTDGFVFRAVTRHDSVSTRGLSAQSVAMIVKASVLRVGGDSAKFSGHSLRAGYCTQAAISGLQPYQIREQSRHKSDVTLAKYIRPVTRRKTPSLL
jgi:site-specific recombinase XerD